MLNLIFRSSWKVKAFFAVVLISLSVALYFVSLEIEAEKARALESGVPAPVSLNDFDRKRDIHAADEVHVIGWVNPDFNYRLTETRKRKRSSYDVTRRMFVLLGPEDSESAKIVRAAVLVDEHDVDRFLAEMAGNVETLDGGRLVFRLNGTAERSPELEDMANDALGKLGVVKAPDFQFVEIWSKAGRADDLAPSDFGYQLAYVTAALGSLFLLMAVTGFRRRGQKVGNLAGPVAPVGQGLASETGRGMRIPTVNASLQKDASTTARQPKAGTSAIYLLYVLGGLVAFAGIIPQLLQHQVDTEPSARLELMAEFGSLLGATGLALFITFFAMGVFVVGAVSRLYRKIFRRPERPLTRRFLVETIVVLAITIASWAAVVDLGHLVSPTFLGFAIFTTAVAWFRLTLLCVKLVGFMRSKAIIAVADMAAVAIPKQQEPAAPKAQLQSAPRPENGPIKTLPSLSKRLEANLHSGKLLQWAPLAVGLVVMAVSSFLFESTSVASISTVWEDGFPDLGGAVAGTRNIIFGSVALGAVLLLLVSRYAARRNIAYPNDPWARLERMAAAERARG